MRIFKRGKYKLNYFNRFILTINIALILISYMVYLNKFFTPTQFPYLNFISIVFPILFGFNTILLVYWFIISRRYFFILLILSFGLVYPFYLSYPLIRFFKPDKLVSNLTVMTFNTHSFRGEGTIELIQENLTDILFFQEGTERTHKKLKKEGLKNYYAEHNEGLGIYSKFPIIKFGKIESPKSAQSGISVYADIDLGRDTIRVINLYMEPMFIEKELVKEILEANTTNKIEKNSKKIESKLIKGMQVHQKQLEIIIPYIKNSPHPILLACDLNSTPASYEYYAITKYLYDSYLEVGKGNGTTFHGFKFPIRIDYIFHSKEFKVVEADIVRRKISDHYPLIIKYKLGE